MKTLEENEYIKSIRASSTVTFYQITERGIEAYSKWIKDYLTFARLELVPIEQRSEKTKDNSIVMVSVVMFDMMACL